MMLLEAVAILAGVAAAPDLIRNKAVKVFTDNAACVFGFKKKHSQEILAHSVLKGNEYIEKHSLERRNIFPHFSRERCVLGT